jgi:D-alanyl-D-alanine carboxypeptidase
MRYFLKIIIAMNMLAANKSSAQNITQSDVDKIVNMALAKFDIPAMAVVIMNNERRYVYSIQGKRKINSNDAVDKDDFFHIGSCSKSMLAVIAGKLIEQNKISWTSTFFDVLPELKMNSNPEYYAIKLEDLFTCEAGIKPYTTSEEIFPIINPNAPNKRYEFARWLLAQPASSKRDIKGKFEHLYSNAGYTLAALMLETAAGLSWENLVEGMMEQLKLKVSFGFPVELSHEQPYGHGYFDYDPQKNIAIERKTLRVFGPDDAYRLNELIAPAGDLSMPALDYARYTQLHLEGLTGFANYLKSETWDYIHFSRKGFSIGVGNSTYYKKRITGFDGSAGTFYCRSIILPNDNLAFTIMTNAGSQKAVNWVTMKITKTYYRWWWKIWM